MIITRFYRIFIAICFSFVYLNANTNIHKQWLEKQPRSYAKDFYLSLYLKQNISPQDAIWALGEANKVNNKFLYLYAKKLKHKDTNEVVRCIKKPTKNLQNEDASCIELGLSSYKATKLSHQNLTTLITKLSEDYNRSANKLKIIDAKIPFIALMNSSSETFFDIFNSVGSDFRNKHFNHHIPLKLFNILQKDKKRFAQMIKLIVTNHNLTKPQQSLLQIDGKNLNHKTQFFLSLNAIKQDKNKLALRYLDLASKSAYYMFDKDKIMYWQYQLNKDNIILNKLANSWNNDIYSIWAKEKLKIPITNIKISNDINITQNSNYDINNPFAWLKVLKDIKKLNKTKQNKYQKLFSTTQTQGHLAFVNERYNRYKYTYLPNPYQDIIKNYPIKRQILINAIAKQESRFIPTSISTSYALGVMQIMPFLSKAIAKELKEPYHILDQLKAPTNIRYANHHLNFLEKRLKHILFVAYAYNGGIGFTKRMLRSKLFKKGKYEPYMSMELVPYDESKKYGKKVLVNYLLYNNYLNPNHKLSLKKLLNDIIMNP
jgi:soluble lytic murein transglycosylase